MSAKVIFHDGFEVGPTFICHNVNETLLDAIRAALVPQCLDLPGHAAELFARYLVKNDQLFTLHNTPTGRTLGSTYLAIMNMEFWPGGAKGRGNQEGVFFVNTASKILEYWGGVGLPGFEPFTPTIAQKLELAP